MIDHASLNRRSQPRHLRGFVAFVALVLWFLMAILSARPAAAETPLTAADILPDIEAALMAEGMAADARIALSQPTMPVASSSIAHVSYNALSGRFVVRMKSGGAIHGLARMVQSLPVLTRRMERGDLIDDSDITYAEMTMTGARGVIDDASELVGKIARRPLAPGAPLRAHDIEAPTLVKKGAVVTLAYEIAGLRMTHQGVALKDGAAGDVITIRNIDSERTLKGVVADRNLVAVAPRRSAIEG